MSRIFAYCVASDGNACPARVPPPWRPAGLGAPDRISRDAATSQERAACCYDATWGKPPSGASSQPPHHCGLPDCTGRDPR